MGYRLPERRVENEELAGNLGIAPAQIEKQSGVRSCHYCADWGGTSHHSNGGGGDPYGCHAARAILVRVSIEPPATDPVPALRPAARQASSPVGTRFGPARRLASHPLRRRGSTGQDGQPSRGRAPLLLPARL